MEDHVHLVVSCNPNIAPCKIVQLLKGRTSKMIQEEFPYLKKTYWGAAYMGNWIFYKDSRSRY